MSDEQMRAVVYKGPQLVEVEQVERSRIEEPGDAVVRITSTCICGSDLHMYDGRTNFEVGGVFGHENMGIIEQVGEGVKNLKVGDRVVLPFNIACGFCVNCLCNLTSACLTANPDAPHAAYGYADMGPYRGGQADYLRVPHADFNALKLPGKEGDDQEDDFVLLSDVFPTAWHGAELAGVGPGSTVAVWGCGPVGLLAVYSAVLRGATEVYAVDFAVGRLAKAKEAGGIPVNPKDGDPVEQIRKLRKARVAVLEAARPGEEKLDGVTHGIECVGYQAEAADGSRQNDPVQPLEDLIRLVNAGGRIGIVGVYPVEDPGAPDADAAKGKYSVSLGKAFDKGLTIGMGQCPVKAYDHILRDMIIAGIAKPSFIVSHRLPLDAAKGAYAEFDKRGSEYIKVVLKPGMKKA